MSNTMTMEEAAEELGIPPLAVGQVIFDGKLKPVSISRVQRDDVETLKRNEAPYLKTLR